MHDERENLGSNPSVHPAFGDVLRAGLSRRQVLAGGLGTLAVWLTDGPGLLVRAEAGESALMGFSALSISEEDAVRVPEGYRSDLLYAWGDPVSNGPAWDPNALDTAEEQALQAGMHHDGMHYFPLPYGSNSSTHGLLAVNHEYVDNGLLFRDGLEGWSAEKVRKAQAAHGVSVVEVRIEGGRWRVVRPSQYGRRVTAYTPMRISGPAAGHPRMQTAADPTGALVLGTLNNCAHGYTPWGTYLTCEENFNGYFLNKGTIPADQARYGIASSTLYRWNEFDARFDAGKSPNEPNRFGWVAEIDPYDPSRTPVKRTALGRMKHEGATVTVASDKRIVVYMGDDERFEYIYKFVSRDAYDPDDRAANSNLLDFGTLYVAKFDSDGTGQWLPLVYGQNGLTPEAGFGSQGEVLVKTRQAADRVGATRMDRPEWIAVSPLNRDVYVTLTNNSQRGDGGRPGVDAANPRNANVYGHILRWREAGSDPGSTSFSWNLFVLAGDPRQGDSAKKGNIKGDAFGSPDGLWFDARGVLWIQTDVSTASLYRTDYANLGNNQMLAADPSTGEVRRFLTGPRFCEVTGVDVTPDGRTMFVNIQHPGEPGSADNNDPRNPGANSVWPDGPGIGRPRSATVVITREDGGAIGS